VNVIDGIYIDGGWQRSAGDESITVINPYTEAPIGQAAVSTAAEVDAAVRSAHRAFTEGGWPETPLDERIEICRRIAALITDRAGELATTASASMGAPYASWRTLGDSAGLIEMFIESVKRIPFEYLRQDGFGNTLIRRRPVGPVAGIVPWNGPVRSEVKKVIPAILAGCTVVLKSAPRHRSAAPLLARSAPQRDSRREWSTSSSAGQAPARRSSPIRSSARSPSPAAPM
jgi:betaine-aldehyde dehydrogenase